MASVGTQRNGLPVECDFDTIGTHDFAKPDTWPDPTDSGWIIDPTDETSKFHGKVVKLDEIQVDFAEDLVMHEGGELLVEFYMTGNPDPVFTYTYKSMDDWISRSQRKQKLDYQGPTGPYMQYNIQFAVPQVLWTSAGVDAEGSPKLNKMVLRIADNVAYKDSEGVAATIARGRYFAEIYIDPDVE